MVYEKNIGVDNVFQAKVIKDKIKATNKERYGTEHYQSTDKFKQFMHENNPAYKEEVIQKRKDTCLEKYGVTSYYSTKLAKEKLSKRNLDNGWKTVLSFEKFGIKPLFTRDEYKGYFDFPYKWKCLKCGNEFVAPLYFTNFNKENKILPRCLHCFPHIKYAMTSKMEEDLANFCKQYFPNLGRNNRNFIKPKQVDILIPELKLAIEFNGLYWHNLDNKPIGYHVDKMKAVENNRYRLIQIWQQDWVFHNEQVKNHLIEVFENCEIIPNEEYLDLDWYQAHTGAEIIAPKIEKLMFKNNEIYIERSGYFKNPYYKIIKK